MRVRRWRAGGWRSVGQCASGLALLAVLGASVHAKPKGDTVHRPEAACTACHTAEQAALTADPAAARTTLLAPDVEARCYACHDEGPSHHTGIAPRKPVPVSLPLSSTGRITCGTCHFVHGDHNSFGAYLRLDNARGGLCLSCHELSELE